LLPFFVFFKITASDPDFRNEFGLDVRDPVQQNFSEILKDITMYYTKKLDMLHIKLEHHQRTKQDPEHHELVHVRQLTDIWPHCLPRMLDFEAAKNVFTYFAP
jgi:hypothetical protein